MQVETSRERLDRLKQVSRDLRWHGEYLRGLGQGVALAEEIISERDAATARAEGAERERDEYRARSIAMHRRVSQLESGATYRWLMELREQFRKERDAAIAERDRLRDAAEEFVRRVEAGEIRSRRSYAAFKAALTNAKEAGE